MEKLKPCPFCGGMAEFYRIANRTSNSSIGFTFRIKCKKCGTEKPKNYEYDVCMDDAGNINIRQDDRYKAVEDWNRRANDEAD